MAKFMVPHSILKSVNMNKEVIDTDLGSVRNSSRECHNILVVE